ncbi:MAG: Tm-1-like ATP-binding domain-containing protein [Actinomycetia bacterium]|nr:Tm-1-like ATP-binding domain-containing protein [Actinomycetes bacterium]MCH9701081.1 Tm-1-like ATP-binding domain-containing protein [Actinomycetes bacterium]MCH9760382.1 Tm-1-like ATP-binding domain-containing protein [Actinomycetes bacterium]
MPVDPEEKFVAVVGTCDTKAEALQYVTDLIVAAGVPAKLIDVSPGGSNAPADVGSAQLKAEYSGAPEKLSRVSDRGTAIAQMSDVFSDWVRRHRHLISGMIGLGGSGNTALITPGMGMLRVGVPKIMVSTVASGNVAAYVGPNDIAMLYSVVDIAGLNSISRVVLGNAAHMMAGAAAGVVPAADQQDRPEIGLTMFGVTTPCVDRVVSELTERFECLVFHATGTGGQTMEKLADEGRLAGMIDATTTEIADLLAGGVMSAGEDRLGAAIRTGLPYVGSCGALDIVNFGEMETVPQKYRDRQLLVHNQQVTLMRTTAEENHRMGLWIAAKLNQMEGEVRFLIPERGVSSLDVAGGPFHDDTADDALFSALEATVNETASRRLIRIPHAINEVEFADALVENFREIVRI